MTPAPAPPATEPAAVPVKATRGLLLGRLISSTIDRVLPHLAPAEAAGVLKDLSKAVEELEQGQLALEAEAAALRKQAAGGTGMALVPVPVGPPMAAVEAATAEASQEQVDQKLTEEKEGLPDQSMTASMMMLPSPSPPLGSQPQQQQQPQQQADVARLLKKMRAYQRLAREQGLQLERLRAEKEAALVQACEAQKGWQAGFEAGLRRREEERAAERRAVEAEVKARVQEQWAAKGEARARREGKEVEKLTELALALQGQVTELHARVAALAAENADLRLQLEVATTCLGGSPQQLQLEKGFGDGGDGDGAGEDGAGGADAEQQHQMSSTRHHYYYTAAGPPPVPPPHPHPPATAAGVPPVAAPPVPAPAPFDDASYDSDDPKRAPPPEAYADITRSCLLDGDDGEDEGDRGHFSVSSCSSASSSSFAAPAAVAAAAPPAGFGASRGKRARQQATASAGVESLALPRPLLRQPSSDGDEEGRAARAGPGAPIGRSGSFFAVSKSLAAAPSLTSLSSLQERIDRQATITAAAAAEAEGGRRRRHRPHGNGHGQREHRQHQQHEHHEQEARALFQTATAPPPSGVSSFEGSGVSLDELLASLGLRDEQQQALAQSQGHRKEDKKKARGRTRARTAAAE